MTASSGTFVSIVFSFRNEAENIPELIRRVEAIFAGRPEEFEIVFVNDDSTDDSLPLLLRERDRNKRIKIINMSRRFGVGECALAGLRAAAGDAVIYMDADLQDPPEVIPRMIEAWRQGADVVHTTRSRRLGDPPFRIWLTGIGYRILGLCTSGFVPYETGDFKLLTRRVVEQMLRFREHDPFIRGFPLWVGFAHTTIEYVREKRHSGTTHFPSLFAKAPIRNFVSGLTSFSFAPLYASLFIGLGCLALGLMAIAVGAGLAGWGSALGWPAAAVGLGFFLVGLLATQVNIVGIYVLRIYKDVRGRPRYIVKEAIGFDGVALDRLQDRP